MPHALLSTCFISERPGFVMVTRTWQDALIFKGFFLLRINSLLLRWGFVADQDCTKAVSGEAGVQKKGQFPVHLAL